MNLQDDYSAANVDTGSVDTETQARLFRFVQGDYGEISIGDAVNLLIDEAETDFPELQHRCTCSVDTGDDTHESPPPSPAYRAQNDARFLSQAEEGKNAEAYALRQAGTDWPELAQFLGLSYTGGRARLKMWSLRSGKTWPIPIK